MQMDVRAGDTLTDLQTDCYLDFLQEGGAIKYFKTARKRLQSALIIAYLHEGAHLIAMGVIKARCPEYNQNIATRSGWPISPFKREIGYIAVEKANQGRGFSNEIVRRLLDFDDRVFATTSNPA